MPKPRKHQISLDVTPYYHCVSRCVRRSYLCGFDQLTGKSYEHRRQWVEDRLLFLADVFAIDVCAYAVMSNHLHVVLYVNKNSGASWSEQEICVRWHKLFKGTLLSRKFVTGDPLSASEREVVKLKIDQWREALCDISWFMRTLNEPIARQANAEDQCSGRFWEGRFKSQALCDEAALVGCMAYVDLNPIRAKMADSPETSAHTSIKKRIDCLTSNSEQPKSLTKFVGNLREPMPQGLPFNLKDYLELVDWTGRIVRQDKRGAIHHRLPPILDRLDIRVDQWLKLSTQFEKRFNSFVGPVAKLKRAADILGFKRSPNLVGCQAIFG